MPTVYANLIGTWHNLEKEDPNCKMGINTVSPSLWFEEDAKIYAPINRKRNDTFYEFPFVYIYFKNEAYRVQPSQIQIVGE